MAKTIFLDIDGVLNSYRSAMAYGGYGTGTSSEWDPVAVNMLRRLTEAADAKIVISSSWRHGRTLKDFHELFDEFKWDTRAIVISMTPSLPGDIPRGLEIHTWFERNPEHIVSKYVILDDDSDMLDEQMPHFVQTEFAVGLGFQNILDAQEILGCDILASKV
jgi:hypothetical protein